MRRYIDIYLDITVGCARNADHVVLTAADVKLIRGDEVMFRFHFESNSGSSEWKALELAASAVFELGMKEAGTFMGSLLAYSGPEKWNIAGDWPEANPAQGLCSALLNLHTQELHDQVISETTGELTCNVDVCVTEAGQKPTTIRFQVIVMMDVLRLDESELEDARPEYASREYVDAAIQAVARPANGRYRLENGNFYLWDETLNAFVPYGSVNKVIVVRDT